MIQFIDNKGFDKIEKHAYDLIKIKIGDAFPINDGKQPPMKKHPVFIAMHACACCRNCLEKCHHIPKGRKLTEKEISSIVNLSMLWIKREYVKNK